MGEGSMVELSSYRGSGTGEKMRRAIWEAVYAVFFRHTPRWCLNFWRRSLLRLFGARIGAKVRINGKARIWSPKNLSIGSGSWIGEDVNLYSAGPIEIGSNAVISEGAYICTAGHDVKSAAFALKTAPVKIGDGAWIAARAIVLPGVSIGKGAVVGAGAVVAHDVADMAVVAGNPAKVVKTREISA